MGNPVFECATCSTIVGCFEGPALGSASGVRLSTDRSIKLMLDDDQPTCCQENGLQAKRLGNAAWPIIVLKLGVRTCVGGHSFSTEEEWIDQMQGESDRIGI